MSEIPEDAFLFYGKKREGFSEEYLRTTKEYLARLVEEKKSKEEKYLDYLISQVRKVGVEYKTFPIDTNRKLSALNELKDEAIEILERAKDRLKNKSFDEQVKILEGQKQLCLAILGLLFPKTLDFNNWLKEEKRMKKEVFRIYDEQRDRLSEKSLKLAIDDIELTKKELKKEPRYRCEACGKHKESVGANWFHFDVQYCDECCREHLYSDMRFMRKNTLLETFLWETIYNI